MANIKDKKYADDYIKKVMETSKPKFENFLHKKGICFYPSKSNYIFLKTDSAQKIIEKLKELNILVRPKTGPDGNAGIRVSIGTLKDTDRLIRALSRVLFDNWKLKD